MEELGLSGEKLSLSRQNVPKREKVAFSGQVFLVINLVFQKNKFFS